MASNITGAEVASPPGSFAGNPDRVLTYQLQSLYVKEVWGLLTAVIGFVTVLHYVSVFSGWYRKRYGFPQTKSSYYSGETSVPNCSSRVYLRNFPLAIYTGIRIVLFRWTVPIGKHSVASMTELLFTCGYTTALLTWQFVNTKNLQISFWQDRAAHLASCQTPLIIMLVSKNNILTFLTGISHEQLNVLHRTSGRVCLLLLWLHAFARNSTGLTGPFSLDEGWMKAGVVSLSAITGAFIFSIRSVRKHAYEFFLYSHILLILVFIIGGYLHAKEQDWGVYFWPGMIVWGFDKFARILRLAFINRPWRGSYHVQATVEQLASDSVRLTCLRNISWKPGQHVYINLPGVSATPFECHPFTIASLTAPSTPDGQQKVVLIIKAREGLTSRLKQYVETGVSSISALIDGPYGCPPDLAGSSTVVLVAGGSGITFTLPIFADLIARAGKREASVSRILFVWAVRDTSHLPWIKTALNEACYGLPPHVIVDLQVYVSSPRSLRNTYKMQSDGSIYARPRHQTREKIGMDSTYGKFWRRGRPNVSNLIADIAAVSSGRMAVVVAGPPGLTQAVRHVCRSKLAGPGAVLRGGPVIELHTESFGTVRG